jgi:hypothetical protein
MVPGRIIVRAVLAAASAALCAGSAVAKDASKSPSTDLPGVETGYTIVKPQPEPDEPMDQGADGSRFKVGDTDVRISGSITVDVGGGSIRAPQH